MSDQSHSRLPFEDSKPVAEMTLVEVAEQLERVTGWIENERVREREARLAYEDIAGQVESRVKAIKQYAETVMTHHRRKMSSFDGLLGRKPAQEVQGRPGSNALARSATFSKSRPGGEPKNLAEAIIAIWTLDRYTDPLTTEEIAEALPAVGYRSEAADSSLRSSINQALAKLCRVGRVVRFRADGSQISPKDNKSRARKYLGAIRLPEPV